MLLLTQDVKPT